ncbi:unnamed protein product [Peniophora sp. CBMAI 1063]|nr:unnamed protein product [Peniophora sp. CBMAI 1063]
MLSSTQFSALVCLALSLAVHSAPTGTGTTSAYIRSPQDPISELLGGLLVTIPQSNSTQTGSPIPLPPLLPLLPILNIKRQANGIIGQYTLAELIDLIQVLAEGLVCGRWEMGLLNSC